MKVSNALSHLPVFNAMQSEFMPYKDVWQAPSHLKLDQTRLKYSAIFRRFQGASSSQANVVASQQDPIPMWIADMDIPPCDEILSAITQNLRSTYGYQSLDIGDAVAKRFERTTQKSSRFKVESGDVVDVASAIGAIDVALHTFCQPGQKVMVLTPTYSPLTETIHNNGLTPVSIPVIQNARQIQTKLSEVAATKDSDKSRQEDVEGSNATIDTSTFDSAAAAFVICHPNNPTGTVLSAEEQRVIMSFCAKNDILMITDEVHSEFAFNSSNEPTLIPMFGAEVSNKSERRKESQNGGNIHTHQLPRIIHINSVSKAFNLASIPGASYAVIKDKTIRETFSQAINSRHLNASNLGKVALIAAYEKGSTWLDSVKSALSFNRKLVVRFFEHYGLSVNYTMGSAGYFLWLDLSTFPSHLTQPNSIASVHEAPLGDASRQPLKYSPVTTVEGCIERGVIGNDGATFGSPHHIRLNLACHPAVVETALQRLCFIS